MDFNKKCTACNIEIGEDKYRSGELFVRIVITKIKEIHY